jgi:hypothetical protein
VTEAEAQAEAGRRWGAGGYALDGAFADGPPGGRSVIVGCHGKIGRPGSAIFGLGRSGDWDEAFREADDFLGGQPPQDDPRWTADDERRVAEARSARCP